MSALRPYLPFVLAQARGETPLDLSTASLVVTLHTTGYVPNFDTHDFADDLTNELATAGGYTAGGVALTGVDVLADTAGDFVYLVADDVDWNPLAATFRYAVVWDDTGTPATSRLVGLIDETAVIATLSYELQWSDAAAGGLLRWQVT